MPRHQLTSSVATNAGVAIVSKMPKIACIPSDGMTAHDFFRGTDLLMTNFMPSLSLAVRKRLNDISNVSS